MTAIEDRVELISFRTCPFVMRTQITGYEKNVEFRTTYIDLANKPQWFLDISPTGAVPAVRVDSNQFIFESAVICDLIDEMTPGTLHPDDTLLKYENKSWIEFSSTLLSKQFGVSIATDESGFEEKIEDLKSGLRTLEREAVNTPFWNGEKFCIIDAAIAPLFDRFELFYQQFNLDILSEFPKLQAWGSNILARASVQKVCNEEFRREYLLRLKNRNPYILQSEA